MHVNYKLSSLTLLALLLASVYLIGIQSATAQTEQAESKLQAATNAFSQAFESVLEAEKAGANVTSTLNLLNSAAALLSEANNAYRTGDMDAALKNANAVVPITQLVTQSAQNAQENAVASADNAFWSNLALTVVGAIVLVIALFLVWRIIKRSYIRKLSDAKPEVTSNEA